MGHLVAGNVVDIAERREILNVEHWYSLYLCYPDGAASQASLA